MYAEPSALNSIFLEDTAAKAVAPVISYLVLGLLRSTPGAEKGHRGILVQLVWFECWAWTAELLADLHVLRGIRNFTSHRIKNEFLMTLLKRYQKCTNARAQKYRLVYRMDRMREMKDRRARAEEEMRREISSDRKPLLERSTEFGSYIIHSLETGLPRTIYANVRNDEYIENLPIGCCVEVPCKVSSDGIKPIHIGYLPIQCAARAHTRVQYRRRAN